MNQTLSPQEILAEGQTMYRAGDYQAAAQAFAAAENSYKLINDEASAAEMANNRCVALLRAGDAQAAFDAVDGTQSIFEQMGDLRSQAFALGNRAAALEALGHLEDASQDYEYSANILKEIGEHELRADVLQSLSAVQLRTRNPLQAMATMRAGIEQVEHPTLKQRLLKRLFNIPFRLME